MSYALVLDTETTGFDKPFCYDISWIIINMENGEKVDFSAFVVEQVWHNLPLFESAYYKEKRQKYIDMMRRHEAVMDKWGYIMRKFKQTLNDYNITAVYAYNSDFDDKVIAYNCDWFKCNNPIENIPVFDIWGYASEFITGEMGYKSFCEQNQRFSEIMAHPADPAWYNPYSDQKCWKGKITAFNCPSDASTSSADENKLTPGP